MFSVNNRQNHILITGGAGFIGANLAAHLLTSTDARITVFDNLAQPGATLNLAWLRSQAKADRLRFIRGDVRSAVRVIEAVRGVDEVYHLAARSEGGGVSRAGVDVNLTGTLNVLEAARWADRKPMVFYLSSAETPSPIEIDAPERRPERALPVKRGAAESYVQDYARFYNLPTVVFRPDVVAGPRQLEAAGNGWLAQVVYAVLAGRPIKVLGDGLQVFDVLHVADLLDALTAARDFCAVTAGNAYDIRGGIEHTLSVNEMIRCVERVCHRTATVLHTPGTTGARTSRMADSSPFMTETGWRARRTLTQVFRDMAAFWHACRASAVESSRPPLPARQTFRSAA